MRIATIGLSKEVHTFFTDEGHEILQEEDIESVCSLFVDGNDTSVCDAIVIDTESEGSSGLYGPRLIRTKKIRVPVIGISDAVRNPENRALFLEQGGDDLLWEPINFRELQASLAMCMRRTYGSALDIRYLVDGRVKINFHSKTVLVDGEGLHFTGAEYKLFELLVSAQGRTLSKEQILSQLYHGMDEPEIKIVDVFICKLRKKLQAVTPPLPLLIETVWGRGYTIQENTSAARPQLESAS